MKHREENNLPQDKDRHLDVPQEANRDKHINFIDIEDPSSGRNRRDKRKDHVTEERQKQWKQGIEEGKRANKKRQT